jgi:hypothetical protein
MVVFSTPMAPIRSFAPSVGHLLVNPQVGTTHDLATFLVRDPAGPN